MNDIATQHSAIDATLAELGITIDDIYMMPAAVDDKGWKHIPFSVTLSRNGKPILRTTYRVGLGHVKREKLWPMPEGCLDGLQVAFLKKRDDRVLPEYAHEFLAVVTDAARRQKLKPEPRDVVHSLCTDGLCALHDQTFEEWCSDYGYDTDSRKAAAIYRECEKIGKALCSGLTRPVYQQLTEVFSNY